MGRATAKPDLIKAANEELFESKHLTWTVNSTLGAYCVSTTSSHYDWAIKKLKHTSWHTGILFYRIIGVLQQIR